MKLTPLQKFKHDTVGKFSTLKELIEDLNDESLLEAESSEVLDAIFETFEKMQLSSSKFKEHFLELKNK